MARQPIVNVLHAGSEVLTAVTTEFYLLGYIAVYPTERQPTYHRNMLPPSSRLKRKPSEKPASLAACFMVVSCFVYSSVLKVGATYFSNMSADFLSTTWCYGPKDRTLDIFHVFSHHETARKNIHTGLSFQESKHILNFNAYSIKAFLSNQKYFL
jgi:hypothetical protein